MKLENLISYLLENVENFKILDEAALRGFSLDILKKETKRLKEEYKYPKYIAKGLSKLAKKYNLPYMGIGSSRIVYALSTDKVLKIAINQNGIAQNKAEKIVSKNPSTRYIGATVYESDPNYYWSVMEVAQIYTDGTQLNLDLGIPVELVRKYNIVRAAHDLDYVYNKGKSIEEVIEYRYEDANLQKSLRKFLEDPPKSMLSLVDLMFNSPIELRLEPGDIVTKHFGRTAGGRPVLIDYGLTTGVSSIMRDEKKQVSEPNNPRS